MKRLRLLVLLLLLLLVLPTIPLSFSSPMVESNINITRTLTFPSLLIGQSQAGSTIVATYIFTTNGGITYTIGNDTIRLAPDISGFTGAVSTKLYQNESHVLSTYTLKLLGQTRVYVEVWGDFSKKISGYVSTMKQRIKGTQSLFTSIVLPLPFDKYSSEYDPEKAVVKFGKEKVRLGLDFSDAIRAGYLVSVDNSTRKISYTVGSSFDIDPVTVATGTENTATKDGHQWHNLGKASSRYWSYFWNGTQHQIFQSSDGSTWALATNGDLSATSIADGGGLLAVYISGTTIVYAGGKNSGAESLFYWRNGTISAATISWAAAETSISTTGNSVKLPSVTIDSQGDTWVSVDTRQAAVPYIEVYEYTSSSWTQRLSSSAGAGGGVSALVALTSGYVTLLNAADGSQTAIHGNKWTGSWSGFSATSGTSYRLYLSSAVAISETVHLAIGTGGNAVSYMTFTTTWSAATSIASSLTAATTSGEVHASIGTDGTSKLAIGYTNGGTVSYVTSSNSGTNWSTAANAATGETSPAWLGLDRFIDTDNKVRFIWTANTASPFNIRYQESTVTFNTAPNAPTINSPADASRVNPSVSVTFYWTFSDPDGGDTQSAFEIEIDNNSNFASPEVDSGKVVSGTASSAQTTPAAETTYYWRVRTWDAADAVGAFSSGTITFKVDKVKVSSYTVTDTRVNINDNVNIDATLIFSSDSAQMTSAGTITINTYSATHQGSGVWRITRTSSSVSQTTFNTVAATVGNITGVDQNSQSVAVTWDSVTIVITIGDSRVNINVNASITVTATHTYDASAHSGTATLNQTTYQFSTVGRRGYTVSSITGGANGITTIGVNDSENVTWDRVIMTARGNTGSRGNAGASVTVFFVLRYDYDDALITDGTVNINSTASSWSPSNGRWQLSVSQSGVTTKVYVVNSVSGNLYGITSLTPGLNTNSTSITWDKVSVGALTLSFQGSGKIRYTGTITYDSDSTGINAGIVTVQKPSGGNYGLFTANSGGSVTIDLDQPNLGETGSYTVYVSGDPTFGVTSRGTDRTITLRKLTIQFKDFDGNLLNPEPSAFNLKQSGEIITSNAVSLYVPDSLTYIVDGVKWRGKIVTPPTTPSIAISGSDGTLTVTTLAPFSNTVTKDRNVKYKSENLPYVLKSTASVTEFMNSPGVLKVSLNSGSADVKLPSNLYPKQVYGSSPLVWSVENQVLTVKVTGIEEGVDGTVLFDEPSHSSTYVPPTYPPTLLGVPIPSLTWGSFQSFFEGMFFSQYLWFWIVMLGVGVFIVGVVRRGGKRR